MEYEYKSTFDRSIKRTPPVRKAEIKKAVEQLIDYFETGVRPFGLGLKHLGGSYWEIRVNIRERILLSRIKDRVSFLLAGNHDEIKRYLRAL